jgi:hypothetical protein
VPSDREPRPRPAACLNCGSTLVDAFCAACGQRNADMRIPARELALDAVEDGLSLDSRVARTVVPFLFRPGHLTVEWTSGRRARFSSPLRLYLLTSAFFFLATGFAGGLDPRFEIDAKGDAEAVEEASRELDAAGVPAGISGATGPARIEPHVPVGSEEDHRNLRTQGWIGRTIDDRWQALSKMSREEFRSRLNGAFREWVPRVMFFLVPAAVMILALLWRKRWLSEHVVLALHLHALAFTIFTLLLLLRLLPWEGVRDAGRIALVLWVGAYYLLALRRVYGQRWRWILPKAAVAATLYLVALGIGLAAVAGLALYFA